MRGSGEPWEALPECVAQGSGDGFQLVDFAVAGTDADTVAEGIDTTDLEEAFVKAIDLVETHVQAPE